MAIWKSDYLNFDSSNILLFLHKWRRPLIVVTAVALLGSVLFSSPWFITPKYKSTVILYPTATNAISKALFSENSGNEKDILAFGEDEETEQLLQILHSNRIRDKIIERYQLMQHYGIDTNSSYKNTRLYQEYEDNISFKRTEFMAVKISVLDTDPQMAADIANDIAELLDSTKNDMQKQRAQRAYEIVKDQYFKQRDAVAAMEDSLSKLRAFGVNDYESQAEMINQQLAIELARDNNQGVKRLEQKLEMLAKYGGPYVSIRDALEYEKKQLSMLRAKYEEAKTDAQEVLPVKFIVNSAYKAERKSYPIRWLIVLVATISAFLFALILLLIVENINTYFPDTFKRAVGKSVKREPRNRISGKDPPPPPPPASVPPRYEHTDQPVSQPVHPHPATAQKADDETLKADNEKRTEEGESQKHYQQKTKHHNDYQTDKHDTQMTRYFTNTNLLKLLFKWKIHLSIIVLAAVILAAILSSPWFITPMFKSYALIYPSNIEPYSEESRSEQMLEFLKSKEIRDKIIQKYNLAERYKIDSSYKYFESTIIYEYSQNVIISKTPFETIKIEVFDADPVVACNMVNDIIKFYDQKVLNTHRKKYKEGLDYIAQRLELKKAEIDSVENILYQIRTQYGIIDYPNQSREVARGFLRTVDGNNAAQNINTREVLQLKENIEKYGGIYTYYNDRYFDLIAEYGKVKMDYDQALMFYQRDISYSSVISSPFPADKKSYPVRWVIVLLAALGGFFASLVIILVMENIDSIRRNF
jgi:uncharacterized protein involved in exopolysaccharide biosynthesis